jgi:hypothetical protein
MGQLTASIPHEVNQPIAAMVTHAQAALQWLDHQPPNLEQVRYSLAWIVKDGDRAREVIGRIRALITKAPLRRDRLEINGAIREMIELARGEAVKNDVLVQTELADGLPLIQGDRVHLQQVIRQRHRGHERRQRGTTRINDRHFESETGRACERTRFRSGTAAPESRASLQCLLHDQAERFGVGAVDLPFDHRSARGTVVAEREPAP